jgi:FkbM family methyltransferase
VRHLIEVGANKGEISKSFCEALSDRSAWAFEANPIVFRDFTSAGVPDNMKVYNLGMGSGTVQNMQLKVPVKNRSRNSGNGSFLEQVGHNDYQVFEVRMGSVDAIVQENRLKDNFGLWIDVEGFTYEVLLGSSRGLESKQISYIFLEMESRALWKSGADAESIDSFLRNLGYRRIARDFEYPGQFNSIYGNQEHDMRITSMSLVYNLCEKFLLLTSLLLLPAEIVAKILMRFLRIIQRLNVK